jgi:ribosomal-protein-serine acetyltransferase
VTVFHKVVGHGIELRQFQLADAEQVFAVADRNRDRLREWLFWVDQTHSADDVRHFILATMQQWNAGLGPQAAIVVEGEIAGSLGAHPFDVMRRSTSIGYWIDERHTGKGIVRRSVAAFLDYLFEEARLHRVEIRCGTENSRSCAIPERLGFTREGVLREAEYVSGRWVDLVVWSMLEQEWQRRR